MARIGGGWPTSERQVTGRCHGSAAGGGDLRGGGDERGRRGRQVRRTPPPEAQALFSRRSRLGANREPRTATGGNRNCRTPRWAWSAVPRPAPRPT
jgi:hypothetical protein